VRATASCDLFVLEKADFDSVLNRHPSFARSLQDGVRTRYPSAAAEKE
jgi:hypothetical protein